MLSIQGLIPSNLIFPLDVSVVLLLNTSNLLLLTYLNSHMFHHIILNKLILFINTSLHSSRFPIFSIFAISLQLSAKNCYKSIVKAITIRAPIPSKFPLTLLFGISIVLHLINISKIFHSSFRVF